ncbi:MAG: orotidine-5'-phosphate decarboxylase [Bacteroidales bacterium]|nr:orotidine-5'-phosphate decarboxylase [Bacteroidales bacterium]
MNKEELRDLILRKKSVLCVGLDTDISKIPSFFKDKYADEDIVFEYNKQIIDAVLPYTVAFKPNLAFYESRGVSGWISLQKTMQYIESKKEEVFLIADAKRGDIGNTSGQYAKAFFDQEQSGFNFDAVTVAPYMGIDSVSPFLAFEGKWVIILALTSNPGADDFQLSTCKETDEKLFEKVLRVSSEWGSDENTMYVIGATRSDMLIKVREIVPEHFLLIPGVGAQGGNLKEVLHLGWNNFGGILINASRSIIFAKGEEDFAEAAAAEAKKLQNAMSSFISAHK